MRVRSLLQEHNTLTSAFNLLFFSEDPEGELWHSTAIVSRLNSRCVQTKSGSHYKLVGPVNEKVTLQQGNNN